MKYSAVPPAFCLQTEGVLFRLEDRIYKLADVAADFRHMLVVKGRVGSGKTLLLKTLAGVITPGSGRVCFSKGGLTPAEPRSYFVHSQPEFNFVTGMVGDELDFAGINRERFTRFLERNVNELSGGELKRLSVMMAIQTDYDILLLDEPLDMLDDVQSGRMAAYIAENSLVKPVIIATHDNHFDQYADCMIRMDGGSGEPECSVRARASVERENEGTPVFSADQLSVVLEERVFPEITMHCGSGEIVCLFGCNGTGKTLFIRTIVNIGRWAHTGEYRWHVDRAVRGVCLQFPEQMAYQETVAEEIADTAGTENVDAVIDILGWQDRRKSSPFSLSDGEKRIMYLMANLFSKQCCVFDEPFAGLDQNTTHYIVNHFYEAKKQGKTIIYTANRKADTVYADKVIAIA